MANVSYLSYQAPIKGYDRSGVPMVDIAAASRISDSGLQATYSRAYVASGGSTYAAQSAVRGELTSLGAGQVSFTSHPAPSRPLW